jgi:hypothetical protein
MLCPSEINQYMPILHKLHLQEKCNDFHNFTYSFVITCPSINHLKSIFVQDPCPFFTLVNFHRDL